MPCQQSSEGRPPETADHRTIAPSGDLPLAATMDRPSTAIRLERLYPLSSILADKKRHPVVQEQGIGRVVVDRLEASAFSVAPAGQTLAQWPNQIRRHRWLQFGFHLRFASRCGEESSKAASCVPDFRPSPAYKCVKARSPVVHRSRWTFGNSGGRPYQAGEIFALKTSG